MMLNLHHVFISLLLINEVSSGHVKNNQVPMPEPPNVWPWNIAKRHPPLTHENMFDFINRVTHGTAAKESMKIHKQYIKEGQHQPPIDPKQVPKFDCPVDAKHYPKATSVHRLRPSDVDVVAAMGDSLTAAFGAESLTVVDLFIEFREISWSGGGASSVDKVLTFPNILKKYNSDVTGYATGPTLYHIPFPWQHLNAAISGATSYDMLREAQLLVQHMYDNKKYDFDNSWKVLTLFVGGNDLCDCCREEYKEQYSPQNYIKEIQKALDYLHLKVPKMFVNVVNPPEVTLLNDMSSLYCDFFHWIECKCGTVYGEAARNFTRATRHQYDAMIKKLISSGRYDTRDDFTVVMQPFFDNTVIPRHPDGSVDRSFFAPDCFHFSRKGHAASALSLWNSMVEPVGSKRTEWKEGEKFECPKKNFPYFFTNKNSIEYRNMISTSQNISTLTGGNLKGEKSINKDIPWKTMSPNEKQIFEYFDRFLSSLNRRSTYGVTTENRFDRYMCSKSMVRLLFILTFIGLLMSSLYYVHKSHPDKKRDIVS